MFAALVIVNYEVHIKTDSQSNAITPKLLLPLATNTVCLFFFLRAYRPFELNVSERGDRPSKTASIKRESKEIYWILIIQGEEKGHTLGLDRCKCQLDCLL